MAVSSISSLLKTHDPLRWIFFFFLMTRHPPISTLFPTPPLFLSGWDGAGFVVAPNLVGAQHAAPLHLRASPYPSKKFAGRAPAGHTLLRAYLPPGDGDPAKVA